VSEHLAPHIVAIDMNRVELVGNLVFPVEVNRMRGTAPAMARAVIAVARGGVKGLDFVPLTLRGRDVLDAAAYLGEGSLIAVSGHLHSVLLTDRDSDGSPNRRRRQLYVIADRVTYHRVNTPRSGDRA
jgi:single-strand DNA-binding protein